MAESQFPNLIEALSNCNSHEDLFSLICCAVQPLGYDWVSFHALTSAAQCALVASGEAARPIIVSNYPIDYLSAYLYNDYNAIDPALLIAKNTLTPVLWRDVVTSASLSEKQKRLVIERRNAGLCDGVSIPIHGPKGQTFALCLARSQEEDHFADLTSLQIVSIHFYYAYRRIFESHSTPDGIVGLEDGTPATFPQPRPLTHREQECLLWTARGKSASAISTILGLSENTINFYVKNAMRKLGTTNRVVAVVSAVRLGLIQP